MEITRITGENAEYFNGFIPQSVLADDTLLHLGAISDEGAACGGLSAGMYGDMAYMEWLYTDQEQRGKGVATRLLGTLMMLLKRSDAESLTVSYTDADDGMEDFLEESGFLVGDDGGVYTVPVNELIYSIAMERMEERSSGESTVYPLAMVRKREELQDYLEENGLDPSHLDQISPECSIVRMDRENRIRGCLFIRRNTDTDSVVTWLRNEDYIQGLEDLFLGFRDVAVKRGLEGENIVFADRSGQVMEYIEQVTGEDMDSFQTVGRRFGVRIL